MVGTNLGVKVLLVPEAAEDLALARCAPVGDGGEGGQEPAVVMSKKEGEKFRYRFENDQNVLESSPNMSCRERIVLIRTRICSPGLFRNVLFRWGRFGNKLRRFGFISC